MGILVLVNPGRIASGQRGENMLQLPALFPRDYQNAALLWTN